SHPIRVAAGARLARPHGEHHRHGGRHPGPLSLPGAAVLRPPDPQGELRPGPARRPGPWRGAGLSRRVALSLLGGLCAALMAAQQLAWAAQSDYADSVDRALQTLRVGPADDPQVARQAAGELEAGTGAGQAEILEELRASPPMVGEARARLTPLSAAAGSPALRPAPRRAGA